MTVERCKNCGAQIDISKAVGGVVECEFCHSKHILAQTRDDAAISFIMLGEHDCDVCRFSDAYEAYGKAAQSDPKEPQAYFGMALANNKIGYIKDIVNDRLQPICYDIGDKAFSDDPNYQKALSLATNEQKSEYKAKAAEIDYIKREFFALKRKGIKYDCFICVKVTDDETKQRTRDYKTADDIYFHLRGKGYNPFFSEREIQSMAGADYEALILYALYTSECMIIVCGDEAYLNTPWVKNEYTRFSALDDGQKGNDSVTIVFDGKPVEKLPNRQGKIQGIDMRGVDPYGKITEFVYNHTPEAKQRKEAEEKIKAEQAQAQARELELVKKKLAALDKANFVNTAAGAQAPILRLRRLIDTGDFDAARECANVILDADPENGEAWFYGFLASQRVHDERELLNRCKTSSAVAAIKNSKSYENASKHAIERTVAFMSELDKLGAKYDEQDRERARAELEREKAEKLRKDFDIDGDVLVKYRGSDGEVSIPETVKSIRWYAFSGCGSIRKVTVPEGVTRIGQFAFTNCTRLKEIKLPRSLKNIGESAFEGCAQLEKAVLPENVTSIADKAFFGCRALASVEFRGRVTGIGQNAFGGCSQLKNMILPQSVCSIGGFAFQGCKSLEYIVMPQRLTSIGANAFQGCNGLKSLVIPPNVTSIGDGAFYDCFGLKTVSMPKSYKWSVGRIFGSGAKKSITINFT